MIETPAKNFKSCSLLFVHSIFFFIHHPHRIVYRRINIETKITFLNYDLNMLEQV